MNSSVILLLILILVVVYFLNHRSQSPALKMSINPDYVARDIAINSKTEKMWMCDVRNERVVEKEDVLNYIHNWTEVKGGSLGVKVVGIGVNLLGGKTYTKDHHIVFTIRDLKAPRCVVTFQTPEEAIEWKERLDVFFL